MRLKNRQYKAPQGIRACWRFWRHCMCTTGWYPVFVAPVVTAGFALSLYSSAGCQFIDINVGFTPNNRAWNQSEAEIGLFYYYDSQRAADEENKYRELFHRGCVWYSDEFEETFIEKDRTWKVARVMAMIAVAGSLLAAVTSWLLVFLPVPVGCVWPGIVLPTSMLAFIAEGSKFLIFDIALCRNAVWFPSGVDSLPAEAQECLLGESAYIGIAAGAVHLVALLSICLKAPEKRQLDPNFGLVFASGSSEQDFPEPKDRGFKDPHQYEEEEEDQSIMDDDIYTTGPSPSTRSNMLPISGEDNLIDASEGETSSIGSHDLFESPMKPPKQLDELDTPGPRMDTSPDKEETSPTLRISESRLSVMSKMQLNHSSESNEILEKLVSDLDTSLQETPSRSPYP